MLGAYPTGCADGTSLSGAVWVDLVDPTSPERAAIEKMFGLRVPAKEELVEIEATSRLHIEQGALYMTAPLIFAAENEPWILAPTGFVLSKTALMTVRFAKSVALAKFTIDRGRECVEQDMALRLQSVTSDISSLVQYTESLVSRDQLLQDAATGIINIDQNEVMKVLTIASVVGIPPVLVVGIYGMNFKNMPELDWAWGYPYALALVVITALLPLIWFKWKDWI